MSIIRGISKMEIFFSFFPSKNDTLLNDSFKDSKVNFLDLFIPFNSFIYHLCIGIIVRWFKLVGSSLLISIISRSSRLLMSSLVCQIRYYKRAKEETGRNGSATNDQECSVNSYNFNQ